LWSGPAKSNTVFELPMPVIELCREGLGYYFTRWLMAGMGNDCKVKSLDKFQQLA
jgi:hypothetical protein